jgi:Mg/Co/Ni transporter MgtE
MVAGGDDEEAYSADEGFFRNIGDRAGWLVGLLVLQSMSSFILARNEALLQSHLVIVRFLTMLVGAGGNAGNQASVRGTCWISGTAKKEQINGCWRVS